MDRMARTALILDNISNENKCSQKGLYLKQYFSRLLHKYVGFIFSIFIFFFLTVTGIMLLFLLKNIEDYPERNCLD